MSLHRANGQGRSGEGLNLRTHPLSPIARGCCCYIIVRSYNYTPFQVVEAVQLLH